ncbi:hypothetical protein BESB_011160 [Besnoitia besnoiti]|uniref:Uncharacterized protein n=1 Tax=Besnoitia besnoiti TaxID=94643 RepID=A0A2A9MN02_BESBE|nr:hypothetical protein BESB_011160 [Besnoitia besnoiti]PFH38774.1 hypothetical protein BESB_011160 [Besnoitia besnoiti]
MRRVAKSRRPGPGLERKDEEPPRWRLPPRSVFSLERGLEITQGTSLPSSLSILQRRKRATAQRSDASETKMRGTSPAERKLKENAVVSSLASPYRPAQKKACRAASKGSGAGDARKARREIKV